jgi:hypothetical protein
MVMERGANGITAFLVELFPFAQRTKGITIFQFFSRTAVFTTTTLNPIGLQHIQGRWLIMYCAWLAFEIVFIVSRHSLTWTLLRTMKSLVC